MKVLFHLGHPAHFHLFKNVIRELQNQKHSTFVLIKKKDILEDLLKESGFDYFNILPQGRKDSRISIALGLLKQDFGLLNFCINKKPDLLIGTSVSISHVGRILNIPSFVVNEDDASVVPLFAKLAYPLASKIISPDVCNNDKWEYKSLKYNSYHELAYLHPNHFEPNRKVLLNYIKSGKPFVIMRFAGLGAHHDFGVKGINDKMAKEIIKIINPFANVYITSERRLSNELDSYRLNIRSIDIHHVMAYALMQIGDSQTMAAEAGVLGVPFIRYNDFVDRIGYLSDLEDNYKLGYGIKPGEIKKFFNTLKTLIKEPNLKQIFQERRKIMLDDKIDLSKFLYNLILTKNN